MKILVFSDSHGNPKGMIDNIRLHLNSGRIDHIFFLGDGLRDFLSVIEEFPDIPSNFVAGNCDFGIQLSYDMRGKIYEDIIEVGNKKFLIMHGHKYDVKTTYQRAVDHAINEGADVLLFGHTHCCEDATLDGSFDGYVRIINPGSCGKGLYPTYALLNIEGGHIVCGFGQI